MSEIFRINTDYLIENGIEKAVFDPSKVVLLQDVDETDSWGNKASRYITYRYEDLELSKKAHDLGYSFKWGDTRVTNDGMSYKTKRPLSLHFSICTLLRKRPSKDEYTKKSLKLHAERIKELDQYDVDFAIAEFKKAIEEFNHWYVETQMQKITERFGDVHSWNFQDEKEVVRLDKEIKELTEKIKELKQKKFDEMCDAVVNYIELEDDTIHEDFRQPILEAVALKKKDGVKTTILF